MPEYLGKQPGLVLPLLTQASRWGRFFLRCIHKNNGRHFSRAGSINRCSGSLQGGWNSSFQHNNRF